MTKHNPHFNKILNSSNPNENNYPNATLTAYPMSLTLGLLDDLILQLHRRPKKNTNLHTQEELDVSFTKLDLDPNERVNSSPNDNPYPITLMLP